MLSHRRVCATGTAPQTLHRHLPAKSIEFTSLTLHHGHDDDKKEMRSFGFQEAPPLLCVERSGRTRHTEQ
jgi:hypothetical protein